MGYRASIINDSRSFYANIMSKDGRNEVQFYPLSQKESKVIDEEFIVKIELPPEDNILSCCWTNLISKVSSRKRASSSVPKESESSLTPALAVASSIGNILFVSPKSRDIIDLIPVGQSLIHLSSTLNNKSIWAINENNKIIEVELESKKVLEKNFLPPLEFKFTVPVCNLKLPNKKDQDIILGTRSELQLLDTSKSSKRGLKVLLEEQEDIVDVKASSSSSSECFILKKGEIILFDLVEQKVTFTFKIKDASRISLVSEETIMAITPQGVEYFIDQTNAGIIKSSSVQFSDIFSTGNGDLIGVWFDVNEPNFEKIPWTSKSRGEIVVDVASFRQMQGSDPSAEIANFSQRNQIDNVEPLELHNRLEELLKKRDTQLIIDLCSSNNEESHIKESIRLFVLEGDFLETLFSILSNHVTLDPSQNDALALWIKWILLIHGGYISRQPDQSDSLKSLRNGLEKDMDLLPRLLSLKGRLQLLKAQTQLRRSTSTSEDNVLSGSLEENIVYADGEDNGLEDAEVFYEKNGTTIDKDDIQSE